MKLKDFFENFDFNFDCDGCVNIYEKKERRDSMLGCFTIENELKAFLAENGNRTIIKWGIAYCGFGDDWAELTIIID